MSNYTACFTNLINIILFHNDIFVFFSKERTLITHNSISLFQKLQHYNMYHLSLFCYPSSSSVRSWKMYKGPRRVFVPHSPMDLEPGHRVRIMLPSGRISTGTLRYLGHLQGEADLHLGVELQSPDHELHDGSLRGHSYFEW